MPKHVELGFGMARQFRRHFAFQTPGLPVLKLFRRHINGERFLGKNARPERPNVCCPKFHNERNLLERAVELRLNVFTEGQRIERDFLPHPAKAHYKVETDAAHGPGGQSVDHARARQPHAPLIKPVRGIPILRGEMIPKGHAEAGQVKVAAVPRLEPQVIHTNERDEFSLGGVNGHLSKGSDADCACESAGGDELLVILQPATVQATSDDLFAERLQVRVLEIRQASVEERLQDFSALVISFFSDFRLSVHLQEPTGDHAALDLQLMQRVTEQR